MNDFGTISIGVKMPMFKEGDNIVDIITNRILECKQSNDWFDIEDDDIIAITESVVARTQGNYVSVDDIAAEVREMSVGTNGDINVLNPIFSRNRFSMILKGLARGAKHKVTIVTDMIDDVGNYIQHPITKLNYAEYYKSIVEGEGKSFDIKYLPYNDYVAEDLDVNSLIIACDTHNSHLTAMAVVQDLVDAGISKSDLHVHTMGEICSKETTEHGYSEYGLYGSNKATEEKLKLFPRDCKQIVDAIQQKIKNETCKNVHVLIYGDGCFKDPVSGIWEFADPVVAPGYTDDLEGSPNEVKLKYMIDNTDLSPEEIAEAIAIHHKSDVNRDNMISQGTTPRRYVDLIGSLCDLTSGSGDKGTPVIYIKNYFKNYSE